VFKATAARPTYCDAGMESNLIPDEERVLLLVSNKQRTFKVEMERQHEK
jgi:hypothetical protein